MKWQKLRAGEGSAWSFFETNYSVSLKIVRKINRTRGPQ